MQKQCSVSREIVNEAVRRHLPRGWKVIWKRGRRHPGLFFKDPHWGYIRGVADMANKEIHCIEPLNNFNLAVFLHECGHASMGHDKLDYGADQPLAECEAETYAMEALRGLGVSVPHSYAQDAKRYVMDCLFEDEDATEDEEVIKFLYGE
jgi:hypothetical protein